MAFSWGGSSSDPFFNMSNPYLRNPYNSALGNESSGANSTQTGQQQQQATRATQNTVSGTKERTKGTETTVGTKRSSTVSNQSFNIDTMDPAGRQALNALISQLQGGGSSQFKEQQGIFMDTLRQLAASMQQFNPVQASEMAAGNVEDLARKLREQQLPDIFRAQEAAGLSGDALSALMSQDATSRTAEAQQRAQLEAMLNFGQLQNQTGATLAQASQAPDQLTAQILEALGISKGSVQVGNSTSTSNTIENTFSQLLKDITTQTDAFSKQVSDSMSNTNMMQSSSGPDDMLAKLALAQSLMPKNQSIADIGPGTLDMSKNAAAYNQKLTAQRNRALDLVGLGNL